MVLNTLVAQRFVIELWKDQFALRTNANQPGRFKTRTRIYLEVRRKFPVGVVLPSFIARERGPGDVGVAADERAGSRACHTEEGHGYVDDPLRGAAALLNNIPGPLGFRPIQRASCND